MGQQPSKSVEDKFREHSRRRVMIESLGAMLPHAASRFGDKTAMSISGREFSFAEFDGLPSRLANGLSRLGIGRGDIVTLYSANRWEWVVSYYGVLKTGVVINPINVMLTPTEVEFVVRDCGAKAILASGQKGGPILGVKGPSEVVLLDDAVGGEARSFTELIDTNEANFEPVAVAPEDLSRSVTRRARPATRRGRCSRSERCC